MRPRQVWAEKYLCSCSTVQDLVLAQDLVTPRPYAVVPTVSSVVRPFRAQPVTLEHQRGQRSRVGWQSPHSVRIFDVPLTHFNDRQECAGTAAGYPATHRHELLATRIVTGLGI